MGQTLILSILVAALATTACASTEADAAAPLAATRPASEPISVTLAIGGTATLDDGTAVTLRDVTDDSRCPADAACFWAGDATLTVALTPRGGAAVVVTLHTGLADQRTAEGAGWRVSLDRLDPQPTVAHPVERPQYRAVLAFSK